MQELSREREKILYIDNASGHKKTPTAEEGHSETSTKLIFLPKKRNWSLPAGWLVHCSDDQVGSETQAGREKAGGKSEQHLGWLEGGLRKAFQAWKDVLPEAGGIGCTRSQQCT